MEKCPSSCLSSCLSYRLFITFLPEKKKKNVCHWQKTLTHQVFVVKKFSATVSPPNRDFSELSPNYVI